MTRFNWPTSSDVLVMLSIIGLTLIPCALGQGHPVPPSDPARVKTLEDEIKANPCGGKAPPKIVLKLDDLRPVHGRVAAVWPKVVDFAKERRIKISIGIICEGMATDCPEFCQWVKDRNSGGMIEFWNHGWDHKERPDAGSGKKIQEFKGETYEHQQKHFTDANRVAREKLGFSFVTFGAPFNATDASTVKILEEARETRVWLYGDAKNPAGKTVLTRSAVNLESPTLIPNYAAFLEAYAKGRGAEYFVLQGHPPNWGDDRWREFVKIVDLLITLKAEFVLPRDFRPSRAH